jgi:hypothetical protein
VLRPLAEVVETATKPARATTPIKGVRTVVRAPPIQPWVKLGIGCNFYFVRLLAKRLHHDSAKKYD